MKAFHAKISRIVADFGASGGRMFFMISIENGSIRAYRAEPVGVFRGAIVLIHEIWGLVPHIESVADRLAAEGYLVIAPDLFAGIGVDAEVGAELQRLTF